VAHGIRSALAGVVVVLLSGAAAFSRQLSDDEARTWSDPRAVLGGWDPGQRLGLGSAPAAPGRGA
jgi:hypothetical protein